MNQGPISSSGYTSGETSGYITIDDNNTAADNAFDRVISEAMSYTTYKIGMYPSVVRKMFPTAVGNDSTSCLTGPQSINTC